MTHWWEHTLHIVSGHSRRHAHLPDWRPLPSRRVAIEKTHYLVDDRERRTQADRLYVLRHRSASRRAPEGVAVYSNGRGVGFLPGGVTAVVAPLLERLGGAAVVNGIGASHGSIRLRVEVPTDAAIAAYSGACAA